MINNSKRQTDSSSQLNFHFPIKNQKANNISFKNSVYLMKSEQKVNTHRQYLIDFIRDNNNINNNNSKNRNQNNQNYQKLNSKKIIKEEQEEKQNQEILDKNNFFNDYFYYQKKLEKNVYNKIHQNELLMDIIDYIGEEAYYPINIDIMNIKFQNFIPGKISSKSFGLINSYAANTNQGIDRNYNDDRVKIMINMNRPNNYINKYQWPLISYFAIFDGHNGENCAEFLRKNLLEYIYTNHNFPINIEKAISEAFIKADQDYLLNCNDVYKNTNNIGNIPVYDVCNNSGSCGLILLIVDTKLYIANVGDSRCLISCQDGKIQKDVTRDHKPEFPYEKQRIYSNGGTIYQNETIITEELKSVKNIKNNNIIKNKILLGPFRVNPGKLSVSRTIGDAKAKLEKFGGKPFVIIPEPDIYVYDFYKDDIDYIIMGCDGIFDRIKSYEIFECVNTIVDEEKEMVKNNIRFNTSFNTLYDRRINMNSTCGNIVDIILRLSMLRKSYDNVTCIMIAFKDLIFEKNSKYKENNSINKDKENNLQNSYDKNGLKSINDKQRKNSNNNYIRLSKDIHLSKAENENRKNTSQESNKQFYKKIETKNNNNNSSNNIELNKYKNNFFYTDREKKNKININENNKENEIQNQNNKKIQSQSQEKKIRELINLFSINNKKRSDSDNTSILYNAYNSKNRENSNNKETINNTQKIKYKNNILFNSSNIGNISLKNTSLNDNSKEKSGNQNKNSTISIAQSASTKFKKIFNLKRFDLEKNKIGYLNLKSSTKKISNLKMNSYILENENDSSIKEEKSYLLNNQTNRIKSNSTENLYSTPTKSEAYNKRITSRKIIRQTNNYFFKKGSLREPINNEYKNKINNNKQILNNSKNNFFHSVVLSGSRKDTNKYKSNNDSFNVNNNGGSKVNIRKINFEKYKLKSKKFENSNTKESIHDSKINRYEKMANLKYEKNSKYINEDLIGSPSVSIIYTKKRKIK